MVLDISVLEYFLDWLIINIYKYSNTKNRIVGKKKKKKKGDFIDYLNEPTFHKYLQCAKLCAGYCDKGETP